MKFLHSILTLVLLFITLSGDYVVFKSKYSESQLYRGISDSLVHGSIGCVSAIIFFNYGLNVRLSTCVYNIILCTLMSSLIDVDHFIMARSFNFKDFVSKRGIFHCSSFWLLLTAILYVLYYYTHNINILIFNFMLLISYSSHHVRDANRRGLWFYPYGHTKPFNYYLYVFLICILPHIYVYMYLNLKAPIKSYSNSYTVV